MGTVPDPVAIVIAIGAIALFIALSVTLLIGVPALAAVLAVRKPVLFVNLLGLGVLAWIVATHPWASAAVALAAGVGVVAVVRRRRFA